MKVERLCTFRLFIVFKVLCNSGITTNKYKASDCDKKYVLSTNIIYCQILPDQSYEAFGIIKEITTVVIIFNVSIANCIINVTLFIAYCQSVKRTSAQLSSNMCGTFSVPLQNTTQLQLTATKQLSI